MTKNEEIRRVPTKKIIGFSVTNSRNAREVKRL
jgi:hypothetical protein